MANPRIQRSDLASIQGMNDRTARYLEGLSLAIDDVATQIGMGDPNFNVKANLSRLYIDTADGRLWINTAEEYGSKNGWVLA